MRKMILNSHLFKLKEKLKEIFKNVTDWTRVNTLIRGIGLLKLPTFRGYSAKLVVEINPVDELGRQTKRRGLILKGT